MKKFLVALLLMLICSTAIAEYVTILPVTNRQIENVSSELMTLSDVYGKTTTLRFWVLDAKSPFALALNNTNIYPSNGLTSTADLLCENKFSDLYVGAESQESYEERSASSLKTVAFSDTTQDYQSSVRSSVALASTIAEQADIAYTVANASSGAVSGNSNTVSGISSNQSKASSDVALTSLLASQTNNGTASVANASTELVSLNPEDTAVDIETALLSSNKNTIMDTLLSGITNSTDYELPTPTESILIASGGGGGGSADAGGVNVPEPTTWAMLLMGFFALAWFRKPCVKRANK